MIFNEIYSAYYQAVAKILAQLIGGNTDEKALNQIVCDNAFGESMLTVLPALKSEKWQLVRTDQTTPIRHIPTMPLTTIQKQWLKAISLDPRIKLFGVELTGLDGVESLFTPADYVVYDKYGDGDPYGDEDYIARFRTVLSALKEGCPLKIKAINRKGRLLSMTVRPERLEYSEKDDKFRLIGAGVTVNLARMASCEPAAVPLSPRSLSGPDKCSLTLRVRDTRNALERCLLHFAHFEKRVERTDGKRYLVHIQYDQDDETELVIRILSFGPMVEVTEPMEFRALIAERLQRQKDCGLF